MNTLVIAETFLAFVIAVTLHEAAHAAMAALLGDGSAQSAGRLSVNPRRQMATVGSIVALTLSFGIPLGVGLPVGLGWGKPVDVDTRRLRVGPDTGVFIVALAGPVFSLLMGFLFAVILRIMPGHQDLALFSERCAGAGVILQTCLSHAQPIWQLRLEQFLYVLAAANILLAIVNLIPLHPLDGYDMLFALLPNGPAVRFKDFKPYMELVLLVIFFLIPYLFALMNLGFINPGYWLGILAQAATSAITGPAYAPFVYSL